MRSYILTNPGAALLLAMGSAALCGCPPAGSTLAPHTLSITLGQVRSPVCQGTETLDRAGSRVQIHRALAPDGDSCNVELRLDTALMTTEELRRQLGDAPPAKLRARLGQVRLVDAVGGLIAPLTAAHTVELWHGGGRALQLQRPATTGETKPPAPAVALPEALARALSDQLKGGETVRVELRLRFVLDEALRKQLAPHPGPAMELPLTLEPAS